MSTNLILDNCQNIMTVRSCQSFNIHSNTGNHVLRGRVGAMSYVEESKQFVEKRNNNERKVNSERMCIMSSFGSSKLFDFSSGTSNFYAQQESSVR